MLTNFHTHTVFCDGKDTPEAVVLAAIERGFDSLGFSGHAYMPYDLVSSMKDTEGYIREISSLKEKYKNQIQIYLGIEEDACHYVSRERFDYIIGSSHFLVEGTEHLPFDTSYDAYLKCLDRFGGDAVRMAHAYYAPFCDYVLARKPDIVGHFDLITKFDEKDTSIFIGNKEYNKVAESYMKYAARSGCLFEVNTGAMARGVRNKPYPSENLLHILRREGCGIVLSSDSHRKDTLDFAFAETRAWLKELGFGHVYALYNGSFVKDHL